MKKFLLSILVFMGFMFGLFGQDSVKQINLTMVDGVQMNMSFFKKWKEASKFMKENEPTAASVLVHYEGEEIKVKDRRKSKDDWILSPVGLDAKTENDAGNLVNKDYNESDNDKAAKILAILKENEYEYGVAFINFGDKISRYVIAIKGKKLRVNRYNYYKETNKDYKEFIEKELAKEAKTNKAIEKVGKAVLSPMTKVATASIIAEQENKKIQSESVKKQSKSQNQITNSENSSSNNRNQIPSVNHEKNKADLQRYFQDIKNNILHSLSASSGNGVASLVRSTCDAYVTSSELNRYEYLLEHNYSQKNAANIVFDEFRRSSLPAGAR